MTIELPIRLTARQVIDAAREAGKKRRLQAFAPSSFFQTYGSRCAYSIAFNKRIYTCAVGAAFTPVQRKYLVANGYNVAYFASLAMVEVPDHQEYSIIVGGLDITGMVVSLAIVEVPDHQEYSIIAALQSEHDTIFGNRAGRVKNGNGKLMQFDLIRWEQALALAEDQFATLHA